MRDAIVQFGDEFPWHSLAFDGITQEAWHRLDWQNHLGYRDFARRMAKLCLGDVPYLRQREPNLRIQHTGNVAVPWHTDADFGHQAEEWNVYVPMTPITCNTQRLWIINEDEATVPVPVEVGGAYIFRGATVRHGNVPNMGATRYSFDFRLIAAADFEERPEATTVIHGVPFTAGPGGYWVVP